MDNCEKIFFTQLMSLDNFRLIRGFTYNYDEDWFIGIHRAIEQEENLGFMNRAISSVLNKDEIYVQYNLEKHAETTRRMYGALCRMTEKCNPDIYFQHVRRPIMYFDNPVYGRNAPIYAAKTFVCPSRFRKSAFGKEFCFRQKK